MFLRFTNTHKTIGYVCLWFAAFAFLWHSFTHNDCLSFPTEKSRTTRNGMTTTSTVRVHLHVLCILVM